MAVASIQFNAVTAGQSALGLAADTAVTLTDAGGAGATSYLWEYLQVPAPLASFPTITNSTSQVATAAVPVGDFVDGIYIVRLTRDDPVDGISTDVKFFGVANDDGHYLPSAGMNRNNTNVGGSAAAQVSGWFGSSVGSTNVFLDAFLRLRKAREYPKEGFIAVAGDQSHNQVTFQRAGLIIIDTATMPAGVTYTFQAVVETTVNSVEVQLYNITDGAVVAGSTLSTSNTIPTILSAVVTLPTTQKLYEVQTRLTSAGGPGDQVTCSFAQVLATWG